MTLLTAEILVKCPKLGRKVNVKEECVNNRCPSYFHYSQKGAIVFINCKYGEP